MIELKNVSFKYTNSIDDGNKESISDGTLKDVSLSISDGECILLTGGSGCGKTTILRLINGLIPNFFEGELSGSVFIDGKDVSHAELYDTAKIVSTVFQNPRSQFFNVDTTSELAFACENQGMEENEILQRIDKTVSELHLEPLMNRSLFDLSGGQKQKIACASVAVTGNKIILLDEPSANLDLHSIDELRELLKKWKSEGKTIVVAEHRISYLWDMADRTIVLKEGRIIRELSQEQMEKITEEELHGMGLRTKVKRDCRVKPDNDTVYAKSSDDTMYAESSNDMMCGKSGDDAIYTQSVNETLCAKSGGGSMSSSGLTRGSQTHDSSILIQDFRYKYRNGYIALNIPELRIPVNKITAVTGNNGEGKTTFLNCLCGLGHRSKGKLVYKGKEYKRGARQKLVYLVMQDVNHQLFTESVLDEVLISQLEENEKEARDILSSLDLESFAERHPQSLSGGQKQRVAVACAIASGREILLFDEPTSGLDYTHMLQISRILKQLKNLGKTVIVVTHDRELIEECCDNEICLKDFNQNF